MCKGLERTEPERKEEVLVRKERTGNAGIGREGQKFVEKVQLG